MKLRKGELFAIILLIISYPIAYYFYTRFPETVASHWNSQGQVDGYMSRFWGAFMLPIIVTATSLLMLFIPKADPKKENIKKFLPYFDGFIIFIELFFAYLYALTVVWNLGHTFNFTTYILPAFLALFFYIGIMIENAKPNYTIGIRTPWTLANDEVWRKTHKLGGKVYKYGSAIGLLLLFFPKYEFILFIIGILGSSLFLVLYSYLAFRNKTDNESH